MKELLRDQWQQTSRDEEAEEEGEEEAVDGEEREEEGLGEEDLYCERGQITSSQPETHESSGSWNLELSDCESSVEAPLVELHSNTKKFRSPSSAFSVPPPEDSLQMQKTHVEGHAPSPAPAKSGEDRGAAAQSGPAALFDFSQCFDERHPISCIPMGSPQLCDEVDAVCKSPPPNQKAALSFLMN